MTKILIDVEGALHKALKIRAIEEGVSMAEGAIRGIELYVRKDRIKGKSGGKNEHRNLE